MLKWPMYCKLLFRKNCTGEAIQNVCRSLANIGDTLTFNTF